MALKLMDPVYKEMPFFQANQVLTVEHLNDLAGTFRSRSAIPAISLSAAVLCVA